MCRAATITEVGIPLGSSAAEVFNLEIWELFYTHAGSDDWRVK